MCAESYVRGRDPCRHICSLFTRQRSLSWSEGSGAKPEKRGKLDQNLNMPMLTIWKSSEGIDFPLIYVSYEITLIRDVRISIPLSQIVE